VAEDTKKEDGGNEGKKKGMSPLVLIAIGALVGGAGVVFAVPAKTVEVHVEQPAPEWSSRQIHPDVFEHTFNPAQKVGRATALLWFTFMYRFREDLENEVMETMEAYMPLAESNTLQMLSGRSLKELQSAAGMAAVEADLIAELNQTLFADFQQDGKLAEVTDIVWKKRLFQ